MFFSFDGIDGTGKSTQMSQFCDWLTQHGCDVVTCRDPGSTPLGERIREVLLHSDDRTPIARRSEMLLYMAARAQLVEEIIRPALSAGKTVVSDRYLLANVVYQGYAGGLGIETIRTVGAVATDGVSPDAIFLLDMSPEAADRRLNRELDRMERQGSEYRKRLRDGFLAETALPNSKIHVIDADRPVDAVHADVIQIASRLISFRR
jgi:dTMP kinase